ncbi:hypothetical protein [Colwellia sp. TT2012]|uniref:hypothetical protein n=1 Tax=Colwellia sp. TT2012 TaxID=1720342 RepID=UPI00070A55E0|nr:hypothetical protein [Colwellia sp. TT2012]
MDASAYTLIGALGGVIVTQVANFLLEAKKGENLKVVKHLELVETRKHELSKERRLAYAKYLVEFDHYVNEPSKGQAFLLGSYYTALILAPENTSRLLIASLNFVMDWEMDQVMDCKKELYHSMQGDIEI